MFSLVALVVASVSVALSAFTGDDHRQGMHVINNLCRTCHGNTDQVLHQASHQAPHQAPHHVSHPVHYGAPHSNQHVGIGSSVASASAVGGAASAAASILDSQQQNSHSHSYNEPMAYNSLPASYQAAEYYPYAGLQTGPYPGPRASPHAGPHADPHTNPHHGQNCVGPICNIVQNFHNNPPKRSAANAFKKCFKRRTHGVQHYPPPSAPFL